MYVESIPADLPLLGAICRRHGVSRLSLFGSAIRADFDPARSDIDVLVEFERSPSLFQIGELLMDLRQSFGREVDLLLPSELPPQYRDEVVRNSRVVYAA